MHVDDMVVDAGLVLLQHFKESVDVFTGCEELQVGLLGLEQGDHEPKPCGTTPSKTLTRTDGVEYLLEDVTSCRSPAHYGVCGGFAVDAGLRVDGEDSSSVHLLQLIL